MLDQNQQAALAELEFRRRRRAEMPTIDLVTNLEPTWLRPDHLVDYTAELEKADEGPVRLGAAAPPRHSKTETTLTFCVRRLLRRPTARIAYVSYGTEIAWEKSRRCYAMAEAAGVRLRRGKQRAGRWETEDGGSFFAVGLSGTFTGKGFDLIVIDDPHKDRADAESAIKRRRVHEWYTGTALTRLQPGGSVIVTHTRWHTDDLLGKLRAEDEKKPEGKRRWTFRDFPAIRADGSALWPAFWPLDALAERRENEYDWWSLYMCSPRPRGAAVFNDVRFYSKLPSTRIRYAIGVDLAYTDDTHSDYSVAVVLAESEGTFYVVDVLRLQVQSPVFAQRLKHLVDKYPGAKVWMYGSGVERGTVDHIKKDVPRLHLRTPKAGQDKLVRALGVSAAWNGTPDPNDPSRLIKPPRVLVPQRPELVDIAEDDSPDVRDMVREQYFAPRDPFPWVNDFILELHAFTGLKDVHDDQVDALAAAYDALAGRKEPGPSTASAVGGGGKNPVWGD